MRAHCLASLPLLLLASTNAERLTPASGVLRFRGGLTCKASSASGRSSSVRDACRSLCNKPGLIAASGGTQTLATRHIRGVVFGGMDGILTTFALLAAAEGSRHTPTTLTLVIGISTVLADALSMAAGEYLSAKAEAELEGAEPISDDEAGPLEKAAAMFVAFTLFGSMPLIGYVISAMISSSTGIAGDPASSFLMSLAITLCALFGLGALKSQFGAGVWWRAGLEVTGIGGVAASVAYFTAQVVDKLVGTSQ